MIEIYYDIISPYAYIGLELFKRSPLFTKQQFQLTPILLAQALKLTENPGPNGIAKKRLPTILDACLQAKFYDIDFVGPPKHPFINLPAMRFLHCINNHKLRLELAIIINRACWAQGVPVETEEEIIEVLKKNLIWQEQWHNLDEFIKKNDGRGKLKKATFEAVDKGLFGVPTFRYENINFWGSDRIKLLEDFIKRPQYYRNNNYQKIITQSIKPL